MKRLFPPILLYTNFGRDTDSCDDVSADKFKSDIQTLLDRGYFSVSLVNMSSCSEKEKMFCIVLCGGYSNHYEVAFPVLKELNVHADAFIPTDLVGKTSFPGLERFIPHFSWEEATEMHQSGLVDIYGMWHPFDDGKDIIAEVQSKAEAIITHVSDCNDQLLFLFPSNIHSQDILTALTNAGMMGYLVDYYNATAADIKSGALPYICVNQGSNILDAIDMLQYRCYTTLKRNESILQSESIQVPSWEYESGDAILPIDENPQARNLLRHAIPLSIIGATRKDRAEMIILNNYIDVVFRPWYHFFDYDNHLYLSWPELICNRIMGDYFRELKINIADCVISGLKTGYYSDIWLDAYYIPGKGMYQKIHLAHNVLIYGYSKISNEFLALSYTDSGHYDRLKIEPKNLIRACSNEYFISLQLIKNNPQALVDYNNVLIIDNLKRYIESRYELANNTKDSHYDSNQLCNYNACLAFPGYLEATAKKEGWIYTVALYGFLEHKKLMGWRLEHIAKKHGLYIDEYSHYKLYVEENTERIRLLGMKYQYTGNIEIVRRMVEIMNILVAKEKEMILRMVHEFR